MCETRQSAEQCLMSFDGSDPEDGDYYRCTVHGYLVLGDAYVCEGYTPPPYVEPGLRVTRIAYRCPECGQTWTVLDDPNEWAYGHDCEV